MSRSKKYENRLSNKTFRIFCLQAPESELFELKKNEAVLFEVIVSSTTVQYRRFLDVRAFLGLDFLLLEVYR